MEEARIFYNNEDNSPCKDTENVSFIIRKKKKNNRKPIKDPRYDEHLQIEFHLFNSPITNMKESKDEVYMSMPDINKANTKPQQFTNKNYTKGSWRVYKCYLNSQEQTCPCTSNTMLKLMKNIYNSYQKKLARKAVSKNKFCNTNTAGSNKIIDGDILEDTEKMNRELSTVISLLHEIRTELGIESPTRVLTKSDLVHKVKQYFIRKTNSEKKEILKKLDVIPSFLRKAASERSFLVKLSSRACFPKDSHKSNGLKKTSTTEYNEFENNMNGKKIKDITKTRTFDRSAYVKIRDSLSDTTSGHFSSHINLQNINHGFTACTEVTIGRAGVPTFPVEPSTISNEIEVDTKGSTPICGSLEINKKSHLKGRKSATCVLNLRNNPIKSSVSLTYPQNDKIDSVTKCLHDTPLPVAMGDDCDDDYSLLYYVPFDLYEYVNPVSLCYISNTSTDLDSRNSFDSVVVIKSESSLSLSTNSSKTRRTTSEFCFTNIESDTTLYLGYTASNDGTDEKLSNSTSGDRKKPSEVIDCCNIQFHNPREKKYKRKDKLANSDQVTVLRMSEMKLSIQQAQSKDNEYPDNYPDNEYAKTDTKKINNKYDIGEIVDEPLINAESPTNSSIYLLVSSDDTGYSADDVICIGISENLSNWKRHNIGDSSFSHKLEPRGMKICTRGKRIVMEEIPKEEKDHNIANKKGQLQPVPNMNIRTKDKKNHKYKQIKTTNKVVPITVKKHVAATDTTADRPCCCAVPKTVASRKLSWKRVPHNQKCVANVVSQVITPALQDQMGMRGLSPYFSISPCQIPPCHGTPSSHDPPMPKQTAISDCRGRPLNPHLECERINRNLSPVKLTGQWVPCQPKTAAKNINVSFRPEIKLPQKMNGGYKLCSEIIQTLPETVPCVNMQSQCVGGVPIEDKGNDPAVITLAKDHCTKCYVKADACGCTGDKKGVKLRPLCPCEMYKPLISMTEMGPKKGTRSFGCDPGCPYSRANRAKLWYASDPKARGDKIIRRLGGSLSRIRKGGVNTEATQDQVDYTDSNVNKGLKDCECHEKRVKNNKVICECPPSEPEPQESEEAENYEHDFSEYFAYYWDDNKLDAKLKSDLTHTTSGFKFTKKKKPRPEPIPDVDVSLADAVRYYTLMHPEILREVCPLRKENISKPCTCDTGESWFKFPKKTKRVLLPAEENNTYEDDMNVEPLLNQPAEQFYEQPSDQLPIQLEEDEPRGIKFSIGGKGSGTKGLSGICCFDVTQSVTYQN